MKKIQDILERLLTEIEQAKKLIAEQISKEERLEIRKDEK